MGEVRVRLFSKLDQDGSRRREWPGDVRFGGRRPRVLGTVAFLFLWMIAALEAFAQDEPPKVEPPPTAPQAPADLPASQIPPPPEVQKKEATPAETQKKTETEPAEKQNVVPSAPDDVEKKTSTQPAPNRDAAIEAVQALSTRYRFIEKYGVEADPARPQLILQYRIYEQSTSKVVRETAQAAPQRSETSRTAIYTERAGKVSRLGEPTDLMRRYDSVSRKDLVPVKTMNPPFLEGLSVWYHYRPPMLPQVLPLGNDRLLREEEYAVIADEICVPRLANFFPRVPVRLKESWEITPEDVLKVSGQLPDANDFEMKATLESVNKIPQANTWVAEIHVEGHYDVFANPSAFNAQIDFTFEPAGVSFPGRATDGGPRVVEAAGQISRALLSHRAAMNQREGASRLKGTITRELVLHRGPLKRLAGEPESAATPLALPDPIPAPKEGDRQTWLIYQHPDGRFYFEHPQELYPPPGGAGQPGIHLLDHRPSGDAILAVVVPPQTGAAAGGEKFRDPASFKKSLEEDWTAQELTVTKGTDDWLPDDDWKDAKRKVYRIEAAFKKEDSEKVIYGDFYFVQFSRDQFITVYAYTERPDHVAHRKNTEEVIRSFQFVPLERRSQQPQAKQPATTPAASPAEGAPPTSAPAAPPGAAAAPPR